MKKSVLFLALFATFAMIFVSCSKKNDSSDNGSNVTAYGITISDNIEFGTVTASETSAVEGTAITLTAIPEDGYTLDHYDVYKTDDQSVTVQVDNNTFVMPAYDVTVDAEFTPVQPDEYGTITVAGQQYTILIGAYNVHFDEDLQANVVTIVLADGMTEDADLFSVVIPYYENIPTGTFNYCMQSTIPEGMCGGLFKSNNNELICMEGDITIAELNGIYTIESSGTATDMMGQGLEISFNVNFEGPFVEEN